MVRSYALVALLFVHARLPAPLRVLPWASLLIVVSSGRQYSLACGCACGRRGLTGRFSPLHCFADRQHPSQRALHMTRQSPPTAQHNTHKALTPTPTHNPYTQTSAMASSSSMLLRGLGQGASKHSLLRAASPLLSSSAASRRPFLLQTRGIYADATGKTYERQGLVMYVHLERLPWGGLGERDVGYVLEC